MARQAKANMGRKKANSAEQRRARFVAAYATCLNTKEAAIAAGFAPKSAHQQGRRLLQNATVKAQIEAAFAAAQTQRTAEGQIDAARTLQEIVALATSDMGDILDFTGPDLKLKRPSDIPEAARRAISSMKVKRVFEGKGDQAVPVDLIEFKLWPKGPELEKLAKITGLFKEPEKAPEAAPADRVLTFVQQILVQFQDRPEVTAAVVSQLKTRVAELRKQIEMKEKPPDAAG
jgi:phage terminase small subunit